MHKGLLPTSGTDHKRAVILMCFSVVRLAEVVFGPIFDLEVIIIPIKIGRPDESRYGAPILGPEGKSVWSLFRTEKNRKKKQRDLQMILISVARRSVAKHQSPIGRLENLEEFFFPPT